VAQCGWPASISKRAPSTTRTSLRLESTLYGRDSALNGEIVSDPLLCRDHLRHLQVYGLQSHRAEGDADNRPSLHQPAPTVIEVLRRPGVVAQGSPGREVVVECDWRCEPTIANPSVDVVGALAELELAGPGVKNS
jgi:hypothetical protein